MQIHIPNKGVLVDGHGIDLIRGLEQARTLVDQVHHGEGVAGGHFLDTAHQIAMGVDWQRRRVTQGGRPQNRQYQIWTTGQAPVPQRLTKVLGVPLQLQMRSHIKKAEHTHHRVDDYPGSGLDGFGGLELQGVVEGGPDVGNVAKEIVDARADRAGGNLLVGTSHGTDHSPVKRIVEAVNAAVERL